MHNGNSMNPLSKVIKFESLDLFNYEYKTFDMKKCRWEIYRSVCIKKNLKIKNVFKI